MSQKELKEELQRISERYYAQPLRDAGFLNYRDDLLNWYKINNGVICHFHILLSFPRRMHDFRFIWWSHPTYLPARLDLPLASTQFDDPLQRYEKLIPLLCNLVEPGAEIPVPKLPQRGAERLHEDFFPQMEKLQTREAVYADIRENVMMRWKFYDCKFPLFNYINSDFADQALMMHDTEMFPFCEQALVEREIPNIIREKLSKTSLVWRSTEFLEAQLKALRGIEIERYMELLKERKAKFMKKYKMFDNDFEI